MKKARKLSISVQTLFYGCITGIICGAVITLFLVCAKVAVAFARGAYSLEHTPLTVVCILMLALLCCLMTAVIQTLNPSCRGSGIPLAEGSARGMLSVKWLRTAAALIAGSLLSFVCGMPLGSEGPSIGVGGLIGEGVGKSAGKPTAFRRYLVTGGSGAGLAVAFNAPLTGVVFSLEETHRRFSPSILLAAFSTVVPAVLTSQLLFWAFGQIDYLHGLGIAPGTAALGFLAQASFISLTDTLAVIAVAAVCGVLCALVGAAFNMLIFLLSKTLGKVKNPVLRLLPAFAVAAVCGLISAAAVGTGDATLESAAADAAVWLIVVLLIIRLITTAAASGSGATGGLFLPMIAIGGLVGLLAAACATRCGIDPRYAPNIVVLCIAAFFAASVRAPISAIVLTVELTASFSALLPCVISVAVATAVASVLRISPLYEQMMDSMYSASTVHGENLTVRGTIPISSVVSGKRISDILWPYNSLVTELDRGGAVIVPDGETKLLPGDRVTVRAENVDKTFFYEQIRDYLECDLD